MKVEHVIDYGQHNEATWTGNTWTTTVDPKYRLALIDGALVLQFRQDYTTYSHAAVCGGHNWVTLPTEVINKGSA